MRKNIHVLRTVADGLCDILDQFVFVGGTVIELYASSDTFTDARQTDDVDCVVEVSSLANFYALEENLRRYGFQDDMSEGAPICRKLYNCENIVQKIADSNLSVKVYIQQQFGDLLSTKPIIYALNGILRDDENEERVLKIFESIASLKT